MFIRCAALAVILTFPIVTSAQPLPPPRPMPSANGMVLPIPPAVVLPSPMVLPPRGRIVQVMPPAGRPIPTLPLAALPYPVPGYRPSAYQVWQNYGVNRYGWMVPRVVQINNNGYYLYNGAPYPYVNVMPHEHFSGVAPTGPGGP